MKKGNLAEEEIFDCFLEETIKELFLLGCDTHVLSKLMAEKLEGKSLGETLLILDRLPEPLGEQVKTGIENLYFEQFCFFGKNRIIRSLFWPN
ncbi:hypothetical protein KJ841_01550 [Patescibacteria group bacterium]|nr:hypothetical protein [Patescibacteria group bacterium]